MHISKPSEGHDGLVARRAGRSFSSVGAALLLVTAASCGGGEISVQVDASVQMAVDAAMPVTPADAAMAPAPDLAHDAASTPPIINLPMGVPVTIIGNALTEVATIPDPSLVQWEKWLAADHTPVLFAYSGIVEIDNYLKAIVEQYYPADGQLDLAAAQAFQGAFTAGLKFYLEGPAAPPSRDLDYGSRIAAATGTFSVHDGKTWLNVTRFEYDQTSYKGKIDYPKRFMMPDVPLVSNQGKPPVVLKVSEQLSLTCPYIPAGSYLQGSPFYQSRYQDEFPHEVVLTKPFYLSEIPVTQEMFQVVMGKNPTVAHVGPKKAVEAVVYADIEAFCAKLSALNNRTVRLPTDAEYEYASRVGTSNPGYMERYPISMSGGGGDVRQGPPNGWGLYDMMSQGWQITSTFKIDNVRIKEVDPTGPPGNDPSVQMYAAGDPMHKTRGGPHFDIVRPNMHGAISTKGAISFEQPGIEVFHIVVEQ